MASSMIDAAANDKLHRRVLLNHKDHKGHEERHRNVVLLFVHFVFFVV